MSTGSTNTSANIGVGREAAMPHGVAEGGDQNEREGMDVLVIVRGSSESRVVAVADSSGNEPPARVTMGAGNHGRGGTPWEEL